jgi:Protein of unknown function (DUF2934)
MAETPSTRNPNQSGQQPSRLNRISRRAHEIYEARGGQDGRDLDDWLQAEREVDEEIDAGR